MDRHLLDEYRRLELEHWWFRGRSGILTDGMDAISAGRRDLCILNVGAATGRSTEILQPYGKVASIEYDEPSFRFCRNVLKLDILQASVTDLPFPDASFDVVTCFDVIEHVEDHGRAVDEMVRVCRPGGTVFVTTSAYMSLWSDHDRINRHFRRYLLKELVGLFSPHAGRVIRSTYYNTLLFPPIWLVRRMERLLPRKKEEELRPDNEFMQNAFTDGLFGAVFGFERRLLRHMDFPFGVSIMLVWRKSG